MTTHDRSAAERRFQAGIDAFNDGKMEAAADALIDAEKQFRQIGDLKRAGDSRAMLADVQRENNLVEQALTSFQRAMKLYREAELPLNEANMALAIGHLERQQAHLDRAQESYKHAQQLYTTIDHMQGLGNVALALGHIALQRGNITRAKEHYQQAL